MRAAAAATATTKPGLFGGRAGRVHFLLNLARRGLSTPQSDAALALHVRELRRHSIHHADAAADLAHGAAGVLSALAGYRAFLSGDEPVRTSPPFLTPPTASTRAWPSLP